jgi:hypothetical protein
MRKLAITLAAALVMVLGGLLVWKADATTLSGSHSMPPLTNNFSPVEKVGCRGPGRCPYGLRWVCGPTDAGVPLAAITARGAIGATSRPVFSANDREAAAFGGLFS